MISLPLVVVPLSKFGLFQVELDLAVRTIIDVTIEAIATQLVVNDICGIPLVVVIDDGDFTVYDKPLKGTECIVLFRR